MSTPYVECPRCGGRALSVATRCPHCAFDLPPRAPLGSAERPGLARLRPLLAVAGLLVFGLVLATVVVRREPPAAGVVPPVQRPAPVDTAPAVARPPSADAPDSSPAAAAPASAAPAVPPRSAANPPDARGLRRYARTWTNVRSGRGVSAPVTRILEPGAEVLADSLRRGWYRVTVNGSAAGYVYRTMLGAEPPGGSRRAPDRQPSSR